MPHRISMRRALARCESFVRAPRVWALLMFALLAIAGPARAAVCPDIVAPDGNTTPAGSPMASGGSITINVQACDASGFGITGNPTTPAHGTASADVLNNLIFYNNNGDGTTVDHFVFLDDSGQPVNVTVNIAPVLAPTANPVAATVAYNSSANPITLSFTGGVPTSVSVATAPTHGTAVANGTAITYTPTAGYAGPDSFTYTGTNTVGTSAAATVTVTVSPPTITYAPTSPPNGSAGAAYSHTFAAATGGTAPYSYTFNGSAIPGLNFNNATGALTGTPTVGGTYNFTLTATDSSSGPAAPFSRTSGTLTLIVLAAPDAPAITGVVAGDGQATITIAPPANNGGSAITTYTATGNPGGMGTLVGPGGGTIVVTGLTNGTPYTFTATATNGVGTSVPSPASGPVTPKGAQVITFNNPGAQNFGTAPTLTATASSGLPVTWTSTTTGVCAVGASTGSLTFASAGTCAITADQTGNGAFLAAPPVTQNFTVMAIPAGAPTNVVATAGDTSASVAFAAPASTGGAPITGYTVTSNSGATGTGTSSPVTVNGLTNGTPYTFTVTATTTAGPGATSTASDSVTPIGTQTITFANPGTQNFGAPVQLNATATSTLPVSFTSATPGVCTVTSGGTLTTVAPGNCTINADQTGNTAFLPAPQVQQTFAIVVPGGAVTITTASLPNAAGGTAYAQTIDAAGGAAPYTFSITAGALPAGITLSPSGALSGVPTASGTFPFTVHVVDAATQSADKPLTLTVTAPGITITPASLPNGTAAVAYSQTLTASGGSTPYTYSVSAGTLPSGLALSPSGALTGTPTAAETANFTVTATDQFNFTGSQAYSIVIGQPAPVAVNDSATTGANLAVSVPVTTNDSGPITSIAIGQAPTHGSATVNALNIVYTPAHDFSGTDTLTYTATGPGGTSAPATVTITVTAGAVPVVIPQSASVLAGKSVRIHAANGATNGPFTALTIVSQPTSGSVAVEGTDAIYTAAGDTTGTMTFDFTLSNAFGASAPARASVEVNPMPVAPSLSASTVAGTTVQVDLTTTARGGPFTAANVLAIEPSNAGSATVQATATGYTLSFAAAATFSGTAHISYTLTNAFATSAPGTVTVAVTQRSDPSKDAEVVGILSAQADATRRMAVGQIGNFQRRLEMLHSGGVSGFSNGISFASAGSQRGKDAYAALRDKREEWNNRYLVQPDPDSSPEASGARHQGGSLPGDVAVWTGGAVNFGKAQAGASDNGTDFTTSGVSFGVDKQFSPTFAMGAGIGYGHDNSDVGNHGSRSSVDSYNVALYASYRPADSFYTDALIGYQWLSFDAKRYVTDNGGRVHGSRDGKQLFGSFSMGYLYRADGTQLTPYGRLDIARARLDGYTEHGDDIYSLTYKRQTVKTSTVTLGMLAQWTAKRDYGVWAPQLRAEFGHDMQGSGQAVMRYADLLDGPLYRATLQQQSREHTLLGAGIALQTLRGWLLRAEYQLQLDNSSRDNQSILIGVEKKFDP